MAESIGSKIRTGMVGILIGLLVIGFAIWGVSDVFTPNVSSSAATVGDEKISLNEFEDALRRELQARARESGRALTNQEAHDAGIHTRVLANLVTQKAYDVDAIDLGIGVNRRTARKSVAELPIFKDEITGKFNEDKIAPVLRNMRLTRDDFEADILTTLRRQQTIPPIVSGIDLPVSMSENLYSYITEQRKATVLTIDEAAIETPQDPGDDTLRDYINTNQARFTAPEYRKVTFIRIEPVDLAPNITLNEDDVQASFEYRIERGELGTQETRTVVQITATSEDSAKQAAEQLEKGLSPAEIATGLGLVEPLNYDAVVKSEIVDTSAADIAFSQETGDASAVLGSLGEWLAVHTVYVNEATSPVLADMREEIERDLLNELAQEQLFDKTTDIENAIQDGLTIEEISAEYNVPYSSIDFIDRTGAMQDGQRLTGLPTLPGIATDETILREIFTAEIGRVTDLFETTTNGWMAARVNDVIDPTLKPFEDVRKTALVNWTTEQIDERLQEKMLDLASRAQTGELLVNLASEIGAGAEATDVSMSRGQPDSSLGPRVAVGLLDGTLGVVARGPGPKPLTRQIALLTDIIPNNDGLVGQYADTVEQQLLNTISADIQQAYRESIFKDNPVNQYPTQIAQALGVDVPN